MKCGGCRDERQRQDGLADFLLEPRQRLLGFVPDVLEQLEAHVQVGLAIHRRQNRGGQFGDRLLRRKADQGIQQAADCRNALLFGA